MASDGECLTKLKHSRFCLDGEIESNGILSPDPDVPEPSQHSDHVVEFCRVGQTHLFFL